MDRRTARETWAKRVERWKESGLTGTEFARELGVSVKALRWWRWRLGAEPAPVAREPALEPTSITKAATPTAQTTKRQRRRRASKTPPSVTFIEMQSKPMAPSAPIEIVVSARLHVRVASGFDDVTLARVLDVLERRQ